jgi:hypothetical protein
MGRLTVHNSDGDGGFDVHIGRLCKALNADRAPTSCPGALCWLRLYSAHIGIALGHEDLVDHDDLRRDPTKAVLAYAFGAPPELRTAGWQEHTQPARARLDRADALSQVLSRGNRWSIPKVRSWHASALSAAAE